MLLFSLNLKIFLIKNHIFFTRWKITKNIKKLRLKSSKYQLEPIKKIKNILLQKPSSNHCIRKKYRCIDIIKLLAQIDKIE